MQSSVCQGCSHLKTLPAAGSTHVVLSHVWQVNVGCWQEALVPSHSDPSIGLLQCPEDIEGGFPQSKKSKRAQGRGNNDFFITYLQKSYFIISPTSYWLHRLALFTGGRDYVMAYVSGGKNHLGPLWTRTTT